MMRSLLVSIIFAYSTNVFAAEKIDRTEINAALEKVESIPLKHNGKDGVWFPKESAEIMLTLVSERLKLSLDTIDNLHLQVESLQSAVDAYKKSNESYLELANLNKQMFDTAMKHMPDLNPPEPAWYESPRATFVYGFLAGGAIIFGSTYLATQALD